MTKTKIGRPEEKILHKFCDYLLKELKEKGRLFRGKRMSKIEIIVFINNRKWKFIDNEVEHRKG